MRWAWLLVTGVCLVTGGATLGGDEKPKRPRERAKKAPDAAKGFDPARFFEKLDKNNDGSLDRDEVPGPVKQRFERIDADGNGKISREEFAKVAARLAGQFGGRPQRDGGAPDVLFRLLDADKDGKLTKDELQNATRLLEKLDRNKDGMIDRDELRGFLQKGGPKGEGKGGRPGEVITPAAKGERKKDTLKVGDAAPDFTLPDLTGTKEVTLSSFRGRRPVVLIFASYT